MENKDGKTATTAPKTPVLEHRASHGTKTYHRVTHSFALGPCPKPEPSNTSLALFFSFTVDHHSMRWSSGDIRVVLLCETSLCLHGLDGEDTSQIQPRSTSPVPGPGVRTMLQLPLFHVPVMERCLFVSELYHASCFLSTYLSHTQFYSFKGKHIFSLCLKYRTSLFT